MCPLGVLRTSCVSYVLLWITLMLVLNHVVQCTISKGKPEEKVNICFKRLVLRQVGSERDNEQSGTILNIGRRNFWNFLPNSQKTSIWNLEYAELMRSNKIDSGLKNISVCINVLPKIYTINDAVLINVHRMIFRYSESFIY